MSPQTAVAGSKFDRTPDGACHDDFPLCAGYGGRSLRLWGRQSATELFASRMSREAAQDLFKSFDG